MKEFFKDLNKVYHYIFLLLLAVLVLLGKIEVFCFNADTNLGIIFSVLAYTVAYMPKFIQIIRGR